MGKGVSINKQAIAKMQRDLQREFDKHPIRVPINADPPTGFAGTPSSTVNHYHAPVVTVNGDHAQVAWGDGTITQGQGDVSQVTAGYETLARISADVLAKRDALALSAEDSEDLRDTAEAVLAEVVKPEPDKGVLRRGATMLRGLLASAATGLNQAITAETAKFARDAIDALGKAVAAS